MMRRLCWALVGVAIASCGESRSAIIVDVRTDFVPGAEFAAVEARAIPAEGDALADQREPALRGDDYLAGARVAEWSDVPSGTYDIVATLVDGSGATVVQRRVRTSVSGPRAVTIVLSRDCRHVECPAAGAPEATECFAGHCVVPECADDNLGACTTDCTVDGDCPAPPASCALARCVRGACFEVGEPATCGAGEYCNPDLGCAALPGAIDAGPPRDAGGCASAADCDDAIACTTDTCEAGHCAHAPDDSLCTDGSGGHCDVGGCVYGCTSDTCQPGPCEDASCVDGECVRTARCTADQICCDGACYAGTDCALARPCAGQPSGTVCRPSAGPCDVPETCDGSGDTCPPDGFAGASVECRPVAGGCDVAEACDGTSAACPTDVLRASGFVCRGSAGPCDVPETCSGSSAACPGDAYASGGECRASTGVCDPAEACSGSSAACPPDAFSPGSTVCRGSAGLCDVAEHCTGSSGACPTDTFASGSTVCRASAGPCDAAERCTGSSSGCPADGFVAAGTVCDATTSGVCDAVDHCTGSSAACPEEYLPSSTVCRGASGVCDAAEHCTGSSGSCPADAAAPDGSTCNLRCGFETCMGGVCTGGMTCSAGQRCGCDEFCVCSTCGCR